MSKIVEPRHDTTGKLIQEHDVLRDEDTGEMVLVVVAENKHHGIRGLAVENPIVGIKDWLDVYPDGCWTIVGNAGIAVV